MIKLITTAAVCLLTVTTARTTLGQVNTESRSARLEVLISRFAGETKVVSQPFLLILKPGEKGSLAMEYTGAADSDPQKACRPSTAPQAGTQVEAIVMPKTDDRFSVQITISDRVFAGCRTVGTATIPVFSNRIIGKTLVLKSGETTQVELGPDSVRGEVIKLDVTLTTK